MRRVEATINAIYGQFNKRSPYMELAAVPTTSIEIIYCSLTSGY